MVVSVLTEERLRRSGLIHPCREWLDDEYRYCTETAEFILWGKLFPQNALGPRCYAHAALHVTGGALGDPAWAIADLRPLLAFVKESSE